MFLCFFFICKVMFLTSMPELLLSVLLNKTLGVFGVVGCLSPTPPISRVQRCQISSKPPHTYCVCSCIHPPLFCLFQNKVGCPPCPYKKFKRKTSSQFWGIRQNIFDPVCPIVKFQKNRNLESGVVLLCWILCRHKKQQFSDKTVLVIASQMGQFFHHPGSLKGRASCTISLSYYQLVASTSCQFTHGDQLIVGYICEAGATMRSWTSRNKSGYAKLLIAVGTEL